MTLKNRGKKKNKRCSEEASLPPQRQVFYSRGPICGPNDYYLLHSRWLNSFIYRETVKQEKLIFRPSRSTKVKTRVKVKMIISLFFICINKEVRVKLLQCICCDSDGVSVFPMTFLQLANKFKFQQARYLHNKKENKHYICHVNQRRPCNEEK